MEIRRKDSEKPCASAILQQLFKCNLDVHLCRDRELPPRCCDIIRGHAKVLQERLPQTRLAEATVAKGKYKCPEVDCMTSLSTNSRQGSHEPVKSPMVPGAASVR